MTDNSSKLQARAKKLVSRLASDGITASVAAESLREYSLKVSLPSGQAVIFYSPKKEAFTCHPEKVGDEDLWARVLAAWDSERPAAAVKASRLTPLDPAKPVDIYVDGSRVGETTAYGVVAVQGGRATWEEAGTVADSDVDGTQQVAGELQAALRALEWCRERGLEAVTIHYDYQGIEKWATGAWKAKKAVTQAYRELVRASAIKIAWRKVSAHTGVKWNEQADRLARTKAASVRPEARPASEAMKGLEEAAEEFRLFLRERGVATSIKLRSETPVPHIQLAVSAGAADLGYLNFYGGKGKAPYPRFHELRPADKKRRVEGWWTEFKTSDPGASH